ncbi:MAG: LCP family protein [Chloroflexi bacterium]|nr:LCP family protein [Chloroflexota bacterium]
MTIALAWVVGANICLTLGFIGVYWRTRSQALAANETPPPPLEVLQTIVPGVSGPTIREPTPVPTATLVPSTGVVNILLMGKDERPDEAGQPTRTDTMMVLRVDFDNQTAKLLALPRDVWVALPNLEAYKITEGRINTAYYYGELYDLPGGGPREAMDAVTLNFGIPLDHFALVNFQGFVNGVDALGGIDIEVPKRIYDDKFPTDDYGFMTLIVEPGLQHMDGLTALRYARTRHQDNDTERIKRQQLVLLAIRDKAIGVDAVSRLPELYTAAAGTFETDLTLPQLVSYGLTAQKIDRSRITTYAIDQTYLAAWVTPGGANVWIPQRASIGPVVEAFLATP